MVKIKQNTSVVDVALNLSGSITGLPAVVDQLPVGNRVGFLSGWTGEVGPTLNMYGDPQYLRNGVNTSNGFFLSEDPALLFEGDRTVAVLFTTGPNTNTTGERIFQDNSNTAQGGTGAWLNNQYVFVCYKGSTQVGIAKVDINSTYLLIITKEKAYLNGVKYNLNPVGTQNTEFVSIGASKTGANPFKGVVHNSRIFNYIFSDSDADKLWNNADPMAYMLSNSWKCPALDFPTSQYTSSKNTFGPNNPGAISNTTYDVPAANGFSGPFIRDEAIYRVSLAFYYHNRDGYKDIPTKVKVEYRCNYDLYSDQNNGVLLLPANEGDAKEATIVYGPGNGFLVNPEVRTDGWAEIRVLSIESVGCVAEYLPQGLVQPLPNIWRDVVDIGQTWTPDLQGMERDLDVPVYDTLGKEKAPYSTDLFALQRAITDGEGYLQTLSNLIE